MRSVDAVQADDRTQLDAFVEDYRTAFEATLDGLTEEQAQRRLVPSATRLLGLVTLLGLTKHGALGADLPLDRLATDHRGGPRTVH